MVRKFAALSSGEAPVRAVSCQRAALMLVVHLALGSLSSIVTGEIPRTVTASLKI